MRGKVLGTMDKIVDGVDDIESVSAAAGATASVASNPDQMPADNQDKGSFVLEKMDMNQDFKSSLKSSKGLERALESLQPSSSYAGRISARYF